MAAFRAGVEGAAPLLAQLDLTESVSETQKPTAYVFGMDACGDNALGATSRPVLFRPALTGVWNGFHPVPPTPLDGIGVAVAKFVTVFNTPPSIPTLPTSSVLVPLQILWRSPIEQGIIVPPESVVVLYANTTGGHTWTANLLWEEV